MVGQLEVDASNACIPPSAPLVGLYPPLPTTVRGDPCVLDGHPGRLNAGRPLVVYGSGRLVVIRELGSNLCSGGSTESGDAGVTLTQGGTIEAAQNNPQIQAFVYRGHTARVTCAKFSSSGAYVASGDIHGHLRVWSYDNEEHLCKLDLPRFFPGPIREISWDGESKRICVVGESAGGSSNASADAASKLAKVIQWDTGVSCGNLGQHARGRVSSCTFRPIRPFRVVTGGEDGQVSWNGSTPFKRLHSEPRAHERDVNCVRYSPDGHWVVTVGGDRKLRLYEGKDGKCNWEEGEAHGAAIYAADWSPDGHFVLTSSADGTVKLWGLTDPQGTASLVCKHVWDVASSQITTNEAEHEAEANMVPSRPPSVPSPAESPSKIVTTPVGGMQLGCAFLQPGNFPVSVGFNGQLVLLPRPSCLHGDAAVTSARADTKVSSSLDPPNTFIAGHRGNISCMVRHASAPHLVYTADTDGMIVQLDSATGKSRPLLPCEDPDSSEGSNLLFKVHKGAITDLAFVGLSTLLSVGWDDTLRVTKIVSQEGLVQADGPSSPGLDDIRNESRYILPSQPNRIAAGANVAVIVTVGGLVGVKELKNRGEVLVGEQLELPFDAKSVSVSPDGTKVAVGGENGKIAIFHIGHVGDDSPVMLNPTTPSTLEGHARPVTALAFSPDGSHLASADSRDVCVWDAENSYAEVVSKNRWCFHTQAIRCLSWCPTGDVLASAGGDDSIFLWSVVKKMKRVQYKFSHRGGVVGLSFSGENMLLSAGSDGCVCHWHVGPDIASKFA